MSGDPERFSIPPALAGERADKILATVAGMSRSEAKALFDAGKVTIDGEQVAASDRRGGSHIAAPIVAVDTGLVPDPAVPFSVRYEDDDVIVVDKPAGVVVHPGAGRSTGTLAAGLVARYPALAGLSRWGIVHRLDRDTSGLLLVGRTEAAVRGLTGQLRRRDVERIYLALAAGSFDTATGTVEAPLGRDPANPTRRAVLRGGKAARTHYRRLAWWSDGDVTLLEVRLETGRTHQIRVHLSAIGHPIVGDRVYGTGGSSGRSWLHARLLAFEHPANGQRIVVTSPLPADLYESLAALGRPTTGAVPVDSAGGGPD